MKLFNRNNNPLKKLSALTVAMAILLTGCAAKPEQAATTEQPAAVETITVSHDLGLVKVPKNPKTVVVFDYGTLDNLDQLGVPVAAVAKSNLPEFLGKYKEESIVDAGSLFEPDFEKINALKPDAIFIMGRQSKHFDALNEIAPTVYMNVGEENYLRDVERNLTLLGEIFSKETEAAEGIKALEASAKVVSDKVTASGKNALVVMANEGELSVYGAASRFGLIHQALGFKQADEKVDTATHGQKITFEYISEKNPDYMFVVDRGVVTGGKASADQVLANDLVKSTKASKEGHIVNISADVWYIAFGGLAGTQKMIEEVAQSIK